MFNTPLIEILATGSSLIVLAFLVNRYMPDRRKHIRPSTIFFIVYFISSILCLLLYDIITPNWMTTILLVRNLSEAFTIINLATLAVFHLIWPSFRLPMVPMSLDLLVAIIYLLAAVSVVNQMFALSLNQLLGFLGFGGGALVISQQQTIGSLIGGIGLQVDNSLHIGDVIKLNNGVTGIVRSMGWRHCEVETSEWDTIIIPNIKLFTDGFVIEGKKRDKPVQRRSTVRFNVDLRYSPNVIIDTVENTLVDSPIQNVVMDPSPQALLDDLAKEGIDSVAYYVVHFWVRDIMSEATTRSAVRQRIHAALKRENIQFARPTFFNATDASDDRALLRQRKHHEDVVGQVSLFNTLTAEERDLVASSLQHMPFVAGETLVKQGDIAHYLYIMTAGSADIQLRVEGAKPRTFETLHAPCIFGEMGLMTGEPRANDVIAKTNVDCFTLKKDVFELLIHERPELVKELSKILAHRKVELIATKESLDEEAKRNRKQIEEEGILQKMEIFFGLENPMPPKQRFN